MSLAPYFSKALWQGKYPIWQEYDTWGSLGLPDLKGEIKPAKVAVQTPAVKASDIAATAAQQDSGYSAFEKLFFGLIMGLLAYTGYVKREPLQAAVVKLIELSRSKLAKK